MARREALPPNLPPRGLSREEAAAYVGLSPGSFDKLVQEGGMPPPKRVGARKIWDIRAVDRAFAKLPRHSQINPWDASR